MNKQKIIGTFVPLFALSSSKLSKKDQGSFSAGMIFLDWLKKSNQSAWTMLPLQETQLESGSSHKRVPSPYKSYGIGLSPAYLSSNFADVMPNEQEKNAFIAVHKDWIEDYALFCSIRDHFGTDDWRMWDKDLRSRKAQTLSEWSEKLKDDIDHHITVQWQLHESYGQLRKKAKELDIMLIGDLPFYLPIQSPLVWAHQDLFVIQKDGRMPQVSGIPNTANTHFGRQIWGHPLYRWRSKKQWGKLSKLWKMRLSYLSTLFDLIRLDHAKAFFSYGVIEPEIESKDMYKKGPGLAFFEDLVVFSHENDLQIYAEDSGEHVRKLRKSLQKLKIPGIKILRFAFNEKKGKFNKGYADIADYPVDTIAHTTTHDTETLVGYLQNLPVEKKKKLASVSKVRYVSDDRQFAKRLRDAIIQSPARIVIIPLQDWLLTTDRINIPGTEKAVDDPNWHFLLKTPIEDLPVKF